MARIKAKYISFGISTGDVSARDLPANIGTPSNYNPTQIGSEGTDKTSAHLNGIDIKLGTLTTPTPDIRFIANGSLRVATEVDGYYYVKSSFTFSTIAVILKDEGSSGTTTITIDKNGSQVATISVVGAGGGKSKSTGAASFSVVAGDDVSMNITSVGTGACGTSVSLF